MMGRGSYLIWLVCLFLLINFVNAESFSVDPCVGDTIITEDGLYYYFNSPCFDIEFPKDYHQPIDFFDKYNQETFKLKVLLMKDINDALPAQAHTTAFDSLSLSASVLDDQLTYTSSDGKIRLIYSVQNNKVKAGIEIDDWTSNYATGRLEIETLYLLNPTASAHFESTTPVVDGIEQEIIVSTKTLGINEYLIQRLFTGNSFTSLIVDPLYQVDYTPIPSEHLVTGDCNTYSDSQFGSTVDITTHMSDNLTVVSYNTRDLGVSGDAINGAWSQTYDSQYTWFLRVYKTGVPNSGTPYIYAYSADGDNISTNFSTYSVIAGVGWKNFQVNSQMDYMTNTLGLNYTKLRLYTSGNALWAEMRLRKEVNDTQAPIIHDCWTEQSPVFCNGQAKWICNITDNLDVNNATFTISGVNYTAIQDDSLWYYNMDFTDTSPVNETFTLTDVYATDIMNLTNHSSENEAINHDCQRLRLIYPLPGEIVDENADVAITMDLLETNLDTILVNATRSCGFSRMITNFSKGLTSDNFETDTEGIKWEKAEQIEPGQSCDVDINNINPGKMTFGIDTANISSTVQCGYNSIPRVDGNFDAIIEFNITTFEEDSCLTFRSAPTDSLAAVGIRAYTLIRKKSGGGIEYKFGYNNGTGTQVTALDTTDTYGKMRIKRSNMTASLEVTPIFNLYFWNNTNQEWVDIVGDIQLPNSNRIQYLQIKPCSEGSNYGNINLTIDNFSIITDNYTFSLFTTETFGITTLNITVNWTTGETNKTDTWVNVTAIDDPPSRPFFEEPDVGDQIGFGIFNIMWGQVIDEENDTLQFNITLLNPDFSFNSTIVSNYGNINSTTYAWNTTGIAIGNYSMEIKVFENATAEKLSTTETLGGTFSILNITCVEDWVTQYGSCLINDSRLKYYIDNNSCGTFDNLPIDNNTYVYCNYCSEDLEKIYSTECFWNGSAGQINFTWQDNNYFSCCVISGLFSDCSILYFPYNKSSSESCAFTTNDFEVSYDENAYFGYGRDKVYWKIWLNDTNNSFKCLSYVKTIEDNIIQVNPVFTQKTVSIIQIIPQDYDSREVFVTYNGIANIYFTNENLVIDGRTYIFGVECSGNGQNLKSERSVKVFHESVKTPATRFFWAKENMGLLLLGLLSFILIFAVILVFLSYLRR